MTAIYEMHRALLEQALEAIASRGYWSAYPEPPSKRIYGATAPQDGEAAFRALLEKPFDLDQPGAETRVGAERSPYGFDLGISYPKASAEELISAAQAVAPGCAAAMLEDRAGVSRSCNLTGDIFVNQSAAFSDYHVSGANPAGNACLTDAAFVANRFRVVAQRRPHAA